MTSRVPRLPELLKLEGWYHVDGDKPYDFKLSCRYDDILRCSEFNGKTRHFVSCFAKGGCYEEQPNKRLSDPTWAIVYVPDKHGNFLGRAFVQLKNRSLWISPIKGNRLKFDDIENVMKNFWIVCHRCPSDTYL